jgi:hypothetical protein
MPWKRGRRSPTGFVVRSGTGTRLVLSAAPWIAAAAVAAGAVPAQVRGATITHDIGTSTVQFDGAPGEANVVTIRITGALLSVTDTGARAIAGGGDCVLASIPSTVSCPVGPIAVLDVHAGDGDDRIVNLSSLGGTIRGDGGSDVLIGGTAAETFEGGPDDDVVQAGDGNDRLTGGPGSDELDGGRGRDVIAYAARWAVTIDLSDGVGGNAAFGDADRLVRLENVAGTAQQGTVTGTAADNVLGGGDDEDYVDGRRGSDRLDGGTGPDVLAARDGTTGEPVSCGPGIDLAITDPGDRVVRRGVNRCERVDDGPTAARPGLVNVRPQQCGASGPQMVLPAMHREVPLRYAIALPVGFGHRAAPSLHPSRCGVRLDAVAAEGRSVASADVSGDPLTVRQTTGRRTTTVLSVERPTCAVGAQRAAYERPRQVRVRSRRGPGRWEVRGSWVTASAEGTDWTTIESCTGWTTIVHSGRVRICERERHRCDVVTKGRYTSSSARGARDDADRRGVPMHRGQKHRVTGRR